jgi:hypothetical protein
MLLCVGKFYGAAEGSQKELEAYTSGQKQMTIPTFFIVPPEEESRLPKPVLIEGGVIAESASNTFQTSRIELNSIILISDLVYLGRVGCKDINGFQIAYISTLTAKEELKPGQVASTSESAAIEAELSRVFKSPGFPGVDILLSNHWPRSVLNELGESSAPVGVSLMEYDTFGSDLIRMAAVALAPRYHFASSPSHIHYERAPFVCDLNSKTIVHVSRFIALADAFNDKKAKVRRRNQAYGSSHILTIDVVCLCIHNTTTEINAKRGVGHPTSEYYFVPVCGCPIEKDSAEPGK